MRLIHAVRDLNAETGSSIEVVALHTEGERRAMFVREADLAYNLGPASARPYLDLAVLEKALLDTGSDAAWVGWGFVAEDPAFAELCERIGVTFIGPSAEGMRRIGSDEEMADAYGRTRDEAERAFGSGVVFLESLVTGARHVEVQVIADGQGTAWALGVRDCSVQRRNQKVIEESSSPVL